MGDDEGTGRNAYVRELAGIGYSRRGFIRVLTRSAVAAASGPFVVSRTARAATEKPLVIVYGVPRATVDPQNHLNTYDESPLGNIFENLVDMSNPIDPYKGWKPMLALSWKRVGEKSFQFKLRQGVRFHNGEEFNAETVKFSIDRLLARVDPNFKPFSVTRHAYAPIDRAEPVDRYTMNIMPGSLRAPDVRGPRFPDRGTLHGGNFHGPRLRAGTARGLL